MTESQETICHTYLNHVKELKQDDGLQKERTQAEAGA
jgi:hypothetical protein